jgi:hypothetical protein
MQQDNGSAYLQVSMSGCLFLGLLNVILSLQGHEIDLV